MAEFFEQSKIKRFNRPVIITEKIDGTNAGVLIHDDGRVEACSKNRVLRTGEPDNFGFRAWVDSHAEELKGLGPGLHRGEWWGQGIQRTYGLKKKRFSLFNVQRWIGMVYGFGPLFDLLGEDKRIFPPSCCAVVPILDILAVPETSMIRGIAEDLRQFGSTAEPGFMRPEGIVIFHTVLNDCFKITLENDEKPKGSKE